MTTKLLLFLLPGLLAAQSLETAKVESRPANRFVSLTAELLPYQSTALQARVAGYIESIAVDRGSTVKKGQVLARLRAPELKLQIAEAEARVAAIAAQSEEAKARIAAARATADRLLDASKTAGAVAANELVQAEEMVRAAEAAKAAIDRSLDAANTQVKIAREMEAYLDVTAPFDGIVSERLLHPGALAGPTGGPIVRLEQTATLRVVVSVPEQNIPAIRPGQKIEFTVAAYGPQIFTGTVARLARALDPATRTMPVELEFANGKGLLSPGMYAQVRWPAKPGQNVLVVPATAVTSTTERTFVIRVANGVAQYVNVRRGPVQGDFAEVAGPLEPGDIVLRRATDEVREGTKIPLK